MFSESMRDTPELAKLLRRRQNAQRPGGDIQYVDPVERLGPQKARTQNVAMPAALPGSLPYGPVTPGIAHSSRFTGATAQAQPMSQMMPPPDFVAPTHPGMIGGPGPAPVPQPPSQSPGAGLHSILGGGGFGGGGAPHPPMPPTGGQPNLGPYNPPSSSGGSPTGTPFHGGGYMQPSPYLPLRDTNPSSSLTPYQPPASALIAALAQAGQRVNPSVGSRGRYQF